MEATVLQAEEEYARNPSPDTWARVHLARERAEQERTRQEALARIQVEAEAKRLAEAKAAELVELEELLPRTTARAMFEHMTPAIEQLAAGVRAVLAALTAAEEARTSFNATLTNANELASRHGRKGPTTQPIGVDGVHALLAYVEPTDLAPLRPLTFAWDVARIRQALSVGLHILEPRSISHDGNLQTEFVSALVSDQLRGTDLLGPILKKAEAQEQATRDSAARYDAARQEQRRPAAAGSSELLEED